MSDRGHELAPREVKSRSYHCATANTRGEEGVMSKGMERKKETKKKPAKTKEEKRAEKRAKKG
jgi:hypothetical protein